MKTISGLEKKIEKSSWQDREGNQGQPFSI